MEFDNFSRANNNRFNNLEVSHSWPLLMRKVYTWMAMALTITGVVAYGVSTSTAMLMMLYNSMAPNRWHLVYGAHWLNYCRNSKHFLT